MFQKLGHTLLIVALVAAIGGHWAVLQTVAWTNMIATNLRTGSLQEAMTKTFSGQHPCKLCKAIAAGKKAEKKSELQTLAKKFEFVSDRAAFIFAAPEQFWFAGEHIALLLPLTDPPLLPPPRLLPA